MGPSPETPDELKKLWFTLANLVVPGVDAAMEAGNLLEDLPVLWQERITCFSNPYG